MTDRPYIFISDLHRGVGDCRDNSAAHEIELVEIVEYAEARNARLLAGGDLLELWQNNVSQCIVRNMWLLDWLAQLNAIYLLGNHDADLLHFIGTDWLKCPMVTNAFTDYYDATIGGKRYRFSHGHEADPYCRNPRPGKGRLSAIYTGIWEDRHGGPMLRGKCSVEQAVLGPMERLISWGNRLRGKPSRLVEIHQNIEAMTPREFDYHIFGHTHTPGQSGRLINAGSCGAEPVVSLVIVEPDGTPSVFDWRGGPVRNENVLKM